MEQQQQQPNAGLQSVLLEALGLQQPGPNSASYQDQHDAADSSAAAAAPDAASSQQHAPAATSADAHDAAFAARLANISKQVSTYTVLTCASVCLSVLQQQKHLPGVSPNLSHCVQFISDASAARDAQQFLQEAHSQAQRKEAEVLAAADAGRHSTGLSIAHSLTSLHHRQGRLRSLHAAVC